MTDAEIIAQAAERTADQLFKFADGAANDQGATIQPECVPAAIQAAGAFRFFAALVRIGIAENREQVEEAFP